MSPITSILAVGAPLLIYALVGPGSWLVFLVMILMGRARMSRLRRGAVPLPAELPEVAILIPAKDEGARVRACLDSVLAQDYPRFHIIAIDDRSTDVTGSIFDEYAGRFAGRFQSRHIPPGALPPGWLGKSNALATAARDVTAPWILFIDSDVQVAPDALSACLALALAREYDAVSIMTRLECRTFWEKLILPLAAVGVSTMCLISLTNDDNRTIAFANGQFFLVRRSAYEAVGGHGAVRDNITEDVALMRLLKRSKFICRLYLGKDFASTRMHETLAQMFNGWARIYSGVSGRRPWRILAAVGFVILGGLSAYAALVLGVVLAARAGRADWLIVAAAHVLLMSGVLMALYRWSGNRRRYAFLFPLGGVMLSAMLVYALRACRTGRIAWRGTRYTAATGASEAQ